MAAATPAPTIEFFVILLLDAGEDMIAVKSDAGVLGIHGMPGSAFFTGVGIGDKECRAALTELDAPADEIGVIGKAEAIFFDTGNFAGFKEAQENFARAFGGILVELKDRNDLLLSKRHIVRGFEEGEDFFSQIHWSSSVRSIGCLAMHKTQRRERFTKSEECHRDVRMEMLLGVIGCSVGGVARHIVSSATTAWRGNSFPWGTLLVNVTGSALLGYSLGVAIECQAWGYMLVGFSGGFTTFSTFSLENLNLLSQGRRGALGCYILLNLSLGALAFYACAV